MRHNFVEKRKLDRDSRSKLEQTIMSLRGQLKAQGAPTGPQPRGASRAGKSAPLASSKMHKSRGTTNNIIRQSGTSKLSTVSVPVANVVGGEILVSQDISPQNFAGAGLRNLASAYSKFRFTDLKFTVQPFMPATASGGYAASVFMDPTTVLSDNPIEILNQLMSAPGSVEASIWEPTVINCRGTPEWKYTSMEAAAQANEPLMTSEGKLVVASQGSVSGIEGDLVLTVTVDYTAEFCEFTSRIQDASLETFELDFPVQGFNLYIDNVDANGMLSVDSVNQGYIQEVLAGMALYSEAIYLMSPPVPVASAPGLANPLQYVWKTSSDHFYMSDNINAALTNGTVSTGAGPSVPFSTLGAGGYTLVPIKNTAKKSGERSAPVRPARKV